MSQSNDLYRYFLLSAGPAFTAYQEWNALRHQQLQARISFKQEFGATSTYADRHEVAGLSFEEDQKPPPGWVLYRGHSDVWVPPRGKVGKGIRDRMRALPLASLVELHGEIVGGIGIMGGVGSRYGGIKLKYCHVETYPGETKILCLPCNGKEGLKWEAPEGCTEIKNSEYWQIRERLLNLGVEAEA